MHGLEKFFNGVSADFFNNAIQFIDFPPEDLEPSYEFGEATCDATFQRPASPPAAVPPTLPSGFHGDHSDASEQKPSIHRGRDHSVSATKTPHFFKIISEESIQDGKLEIPAHFINKHLFSVNEILSPVVLEVPNFEKWEVELSISDGKMWLQNGWKEFAERYSLKYGYLVVFRYEGNCKFHVLVFDGTCIEIEYSNPSTTNGDFSIQILNEPSSCCKRRERFSSQYTGPNKLRKIDSTQETGINSNSEVKKGNAIAGMKRKQARVGKKPALYNIDKSKALQIAASFKSKNPYFLAVMQPSYLSPTYRVTIPAHFSNVHLKTTHCRINLHLNGKSWSVQWYCTKRYSEIRCGWKAFAKDNNLEVGDVCAFEVIDGLNMLWKVVIHRKAEEAPQSSSLDDTCSNTQVRKASLTCIERARALERTKSFKSDKPFFAVVMQPCYITHALFIPLAFARKHLRGNNQVILRVPGSTSLPINALSLSYRQWCYRIAVDRVSPICSPPDPTTKFDRDTRKPTMWRYGIINWGETEENRHHPGSPNLRHQAHRACPCHRSHCIDHVSGLLLVWFESFKEAGKGEEQGGTKAERGSGGAIRAVAMVWGIVSGNLVVCFVYGFVFCFCLDAKVEG